MKIKSFLLLMLITVMPALAQNASVVGKVVDANSGAPIAGAIVQLRGQGLTATTGPAGDFLIAKANAGTDNLQAMAYGYGNAEVTVNLVNKQRIDVGQIGLQNNDVLTDLYNDDDLDMLFDEQVFGRRRVGSTNHHCAHRRQRQHLLQRCQLQLLDHVFPFPWL